MFVTLVRAFVLTTYTVPSASMAPTLRSGDRILVDRLTPRWRGLQRGDVVVFDGAAFGTADRAYVKRVIGVGGDRVRCCDGRDRLTVNGRALAEPYLHRGDTSSQLRFDVEVPPGRLWVMGDHRSRSRDSRAYLGAPGGDAVAVDDVVGRVVAVTWPFPRAGGLPTYAAKTHRGALGALGSLGEGTTR